MVHPEAWPQVNTFDTELFLWLNGFAGRSALLDDLMRIVVSDYLVPLLSALAIFGLWFAGRTPHERFRLQVASIAGAAAIGLSNVGVLLINLMWQRPRPFEELDGQVTMLFYQATDPSFPANAVAVAFAAAAVVWTQSRKLGSVLFLAGTLYGISRVYTGVSYPTDALGGAAVGVLTAVFTFQLRRLLAPFVHLLLRFLRGLALA